MDLFIDRAIPCKWKAEKRSRVGKVQPSHLERVLQPHQKREADRLKNPLFVECVLYLLELDYLQVRERWKKNRREKKRQTQRRVQWDEQQFRSSIMKIHHDKRNSILMNFIIYRLLPVQYLLYIIFRATSFLSQFGLDGWFQNSHSMSVSSFVLCSFGLSHLLFIKIKAAECTLDQNLLKKKKDAGYFELEVWA